MGAAQTYPDAIVQCAWTLVAWAGVAAVSLVANWRRL